jgi:glycosyltransferase involved in cell wall biosynthesis
MARAMVARGYDVRVVVPPYDDPANYGRCWVDDGVDVEILGRPVVAGIPLVGTALTQLALARGAVEAIDRWQPDVVHVFKPKAVSGLVQALLARRRDRPAIVLDTDDWEGKAGWSRNEAYSWWQKELFERQEQWGLRGCDARTAASAELARRSGAEPVVRIVNGYDAQTYAPWRTIKSEGPPCSTQHALVYTRFYDYPVEGWVQLVLGVLKAIPDLRLSMVGSGPLTPIERIQREVAVHGVSDRLSVYGWTAFDDLPERFAGSDIALMPMADSLANRSKCSVRYVDLMVAGVPIVASPVGEASTYVRDRVTGYLADDSSVEALVAAVSKGLSDPVRGDVAERACSYAKRELSWKRLTEPLDGLYAAVRMV